MQGNKTAYFRALGSWLPEKSNGFWLLAFGFWLLALGPWPSQIQKQNLNLPLDHADGRDFQKRATKRDSVTTPVFIGDFSLLASVTDQLPAAGSQLVAFKKQPNSRR